MNLPDAPPWRTIYDKYAPFLALLILVIAITAGVGTYVNDRNDRARDRALEQANADRLADNTRLLDCFDAFATTLAGGLPKVREASALRDDAAEARDEADSTAANGLKDLLIQAVHGNAGPEDVKPVIVNYRKLQAAQRVLTKASRHLDEVREANPYPKPPSEFCGAT